MNVEVKSIVDMVSELVQNSVPRGASPSQAQLTVSYEGKAPMLKVSLRPVWVKLEE